MSRRISSSAPAANVLYAIVPTCTSYPSCPGATLRVYRADRPGTPGGFVEQAADARPDGAGSSAIAIDGQDRIHVLWHDRAGFVRYAVFATATGRWGAIETIEANGWTTFGQGDEGVALALDAAGLPHAVWNLRAADGKLQLRYATRDASGWTSVMRVDDVTLAENHNAWHPTIAFTPTGDLLLAWLDGSFNYTPDGTIRTRVRASDGSWSDSQAIPDVAMTAIDNGPSLLVTPDGVRHVAFLDTGATRSAIGTMPDRAGVAIASPRGNSRIIPRSVRMVRAGSISTVTARRRGRSRATATICTGSG